MAQLTLRQLIDHLKTELFSPASGPDYPIFFVDKVELELHVSISYDADAGVRVSVLNVAGLEASGGGKSESGHIIKLTLVPILTREEQRKLLESDERLLAGVERATQRALRKLVPLSGDRE